MKDKQRVFGVSADARALILTVIGVAYPYPQLWFDLATVQWISIIDY